MKRCLFLFYVFLHFASINAQTDKYIPFPSDMIVYAFGSRGNSDAGWYSSSRMEIYGDTMLNGMQYSKCYVAKSNRWGTNNSFPVTDLSKLNKVVGGIRNDIPNKKVYFYSVETNEEKLLYDFELHLGDTLFKNEGYRFYQSLLTDERDYPKVDTVWVSRIDSVLMPHDGKYHKRFNFKTKFRRFPSDTPRLISSDTIYRDSARLYEIKINPLIEGVGIDLNPVSVYNEFEYSFNMVLFCRTIDGQVALKDFGVLPFMSKANCKSIVSAIDEDDSKPGVIVYPNPSNGSFDLITATSDFISFEIFNCLGVKIQDKLIDRREIKIDLSAQAAGIYFIKVYNRKGEFEIKKISIN